MSKESYVRGFCKAAEAAGVDPQELAKFAQQVYHLKPGPSVANAMAQDVKDMSKKLSLARQGGLLGSGFAQNMISGNFPTFKPAPKISPSPRDIMKMIGPIRPRLNQALPKY